MSKENIVDLVGLIDLNYKGFVKDTNAFVKQWYEILYQYDFEDVNKRLHECMAMEQFQFQPPTLDYLIRDLRKIQDKVDFTKPVYWCSICNRCFNDKQVYQKHFDRCSSVRYILKQTKKYFGKELDKRSLYTMQDEEFDLKYQKLLLYIHEKTDRQWEKECIEHILKPPSAEVAKSFINNMKI